MHKFIDSLISGTKEEASLELEAVLRPRVQAALTAETVTITSELHNTPQPEEKS